MAFKTYSSTWLSFGNAPECLRRKSVIIKCLFLSRIRPGIAGSQKTIIRKITSVSRSKSGEKTSSMCLSHSASSEKNPWYSMYLDKLDVEHLYASACPRKKPHRVRAEAVFGEITLALSWTDFVDPAHLYGKLKSHSFQMTHFGICISLFVSYPFCFVPSIVFGKVNAESAFCVFVLKISCKVCDKLCSFTFPNFFPFSCSPFL